MFEHGVRTTFRDNDVGRRCCGPMGSWEHSQRRRTIFQHKECPHTCSLQRWAVPRCALARSSHARRTKQSALSCGPLQYLGGTQQDGRRRGDSRPNELCYVIKQYGMFRKCLQLFTFSRACHDLLV